MARLTLDQKRKWSLIGGVCGFISGFYLIFITKNNLGFLLAIMGAILLIFGRRNG